MTQKTKARQHGLSAAAALLALLGATALPLTAAAQEAPAADSLTVVRDAETGQLRAPTAAELTAMHAAKAQKMARGLVARAAAPATPLTKYHRSGAVGVRVTDEMVSSSVVMVRQPDGTLAEQCFDDKDTAHNAVSHGPVAATQPVTE
jgi:hypothetical protein